MYSSIGGQATFPGGSMYHATKWGIEGFIDAINLETAAFGIAATLVEPESEIMLITNTGVLIRTRVSEIREMGRATQGVTLISLDDGTKLSGLQHIAEAEVAVELDADLEGETGDAGETSASAAADDSTDAGDSSNDTPDDTSEGDEDGTS